MSATGTMDLLFQELQETIDNGGSVSDVKQRYQNILDTFPQLTLPEVADWFIKWQEERAKDNEKCYNCGYEEHPDNLSDNGYCSNCSNAFEEGHASGYMRAVSAIASKLFSEGALEIVVNSPDPNALLANLHALISEGR
jgi:hypothetical protein